MKTPAAPSAGRWPQVALGLALHMIGVDVVQAGRPLSVDDTGVNERGHGHVEAWWARGADHERSVNLAPAYAPVDGLELGALLGRGYDSHVTVGALQAKLQLTPDRDRGCNLAAVLSAARERHLAGTGHYLTGIATCKGLGPGHLHLNLGRARAPAGPSATTWGSAYELPALAGVIAHVEWFGAQGSRPVRQLGARGGIADGVQLDGTLGRSNGETLLSLGLKFQF